ncbi:(deoxy)nucleoside triphosphate pyrophosphohydrolase [Marispirochaeta aestuarii]|uniref:8-oxo-dGTP diphosphatase n=1 Tax=Marispirochaeta aestuarii TaxID=1963862 RepID=A0A1Y1RVY5_9SPIO|nr:(deoxy)nucleoside triphosphate pyrophosphohydrolase [Marispirochaeta aestuarii]ORC34240.1 NUDIX hydrolase [Marispirochaeta aestuarii]
MRISTAGVVLRGEKVLVALRKPGTSIGESWEFPGGKVKRGERPVEALQREFREELGIGVEVGTLIFEGRFSNRGQDYLLHAYNVELESEEFRLKEHQKVQWIDLTALQSLPMADSDRQILTFLLAS